MDALTLFDPRVACACCGRPIEGPVWVVRMKAADEVVEVCAACAHDFPYKRQKPKP